MISQWSYQKIKWHSVHIIEYIYKMYTLKLAYKYTCNKCWKCRFLLLLFMMIDDWLIRQKVLEIEWLMKETSGHPKPLNGCLFW